jgi:outer membrane lipoprotein-sorting protein
MAAAAVFLPAAVWAAPADKKANEVLKRALAAYQKVSALSLTASGSSAGGGRAQKFAARARLKKPNLYVLEATSPEPITMVSDGTNMWMLQTKRDQYMKMPAPKGDTQAPVMPGFFAKDVAGLRAALFNDRSASPKYRGKKPVNGVPHDVLEASSAPKGTPLTMKTTAYFAPNGMLGRTVTTTSFSGQTSTMSMDYTNVKVNPPLTVADFKFTPPATAKLFDPNAGMEASLVAVGAEAPKFAIPAPTGGEVSLENTLKGKKAVLVNFWFYN